MVLKSVLSPNLWHGFVAVRMKSGFHRCWMVGSRSGCAPQIQWRRYLARVKISLVISSCQTLLMRRLVPAFLF